MAQDYGPAQPIIDVAKNAYSKFEKYVGDPSKPAASKKTTQADPDDVRKANASFQKIDAPAAKRVSTQKAIASKQAPAKSTARKKMALKKY
jgi:hypothetical protein